MQEQRLSATQRQIGELWDQIHALREQLRRVLSLGGGAVDGQVEFGDRVQFTVIERPGTPRTDIISVYALDDGRLYARNWGGTEYNLTAGGGENGFEELFSPQNVNDIILAGSPGNWEVMSGPTASGQVMLSGASPYTPSWTRTFTDLVTLLGGGRAEFVASHFAMGEEHGLGGNVVIAPCASLRTEFSTE